MKIVYIVQNKFTRRDYYRYGIEELINHSKLEVEIWDISKILYPNSSFDYQNFNNISIDNRCHIKLFKSFELLNVSVQKTDIFYCISLVIFNLKSF